MVDKADYIVGGKLSPDYWKALALEACPELEGEDDDVLEEFVRSLPFCVCGKTHTHNGLPIYMEKTDTRGKKYTYYKIAHPDCAERACTYGKYRYWLEE